MTVIRIRADVLLDVDAAPDDITQEQVQEALINEYGKHPQLHLDHFETDDWEVIDQ